MRIRAPADYATMFAFLDSVLRPNAAHHSRRSNAEVAPSFESQRGLAPPLSAPCLLGGGGSDRAISAQNVSVIASTQVGVVQPEVELVSVSVAKRNVPLANAPRWVSSGVWYTWVRSITAPTRSQLTG